MTPSPRKIYRLWLNSDPQSYPDGVWCGPGDGNCFDTYEEAAALRDELKTYNPRLTYTVVTFLEMPCDEENLDRSGRS